MTDHPSFRTVLSACIIACMAGTLPAQPCLNIVWDHTYGGSSHEQAMDGVEYPDGSLLIVGASSSPLSGDLTQAMNGLGDGWVVKLNSSGFLQWQRRFGGDGSDGFTAVARTSDGGALVAGYTRSNATGDVSQPTYSPGQSDVWVLRLDALGNKVWDRRFGGTQAEDAVSIIALADGGCFVAASTNSPASGNKSAPSQGDHDYWLFRLDASGNKLWDAAFGGSDADFLNHAHLDAMGGVVLAGDSYSPISGHITQARRGSSDTWVVSVSATGSLQWQRRYGGDASDSGRALVPSGNGWKLAGSTNSGVSFEVGHSWIGLRDAWTIAFDVNGNPAGDHRYGGSSIDGFNSAVALSALNDADLAFAGTTMSPVGGTITGIPRGSQDYWLTITDHLGAVLRDFRCGTSGHEVLAGMLRTSDGGYVLIGDTDGARGWDKTHPTKGGRDFWIVKVLPSNNIMWYADADGDGHGDPFVTVMACAPPAGYVRNNWDCDDTDPTKYYEASCLDFNNQPGTLDWNCDCIVPASIILPVVAGLQGPMDSFTGLMDDDLRVQQLLPYMEPYSQLGFQITENPFAQVDPAVFDVIGAKAVVDWVVVELRDAFSPGFVVSAQVALLLRDGSLARPDGMEPLTTSAPSGNYHVAIRHRNHLGIITGQPVAVGTQTQPIDLTHSGTAVFGNEPRVLVGNKACMWAGDVNGNGTIQYAGSNNDRDPILQQVGGSVPTNTASGYHGSDVNLDGVVKYAGSGNDRDVILLNIGGSVPTNTRQQQLP